MPFIPTRTTAIILTETTIEEGIRTSTQGSISMMITNSTATTHEITTEIVEEMDMEEMIEAGIDTAPAETIETVVMVETVDMAIAGMTTEAVTSTEAVTETIATVVMVIGSRVEVILGREVCMAVVEAIETIEIGINTEMHELNQ